MLWVAELGFTGARATAWDGTEDESTGAGGRVWIGSCTQEEGEQIVVALDGDTGDVIWAEANTFKCFDLKEEFPDFYDNVIVSLRLRNGILGIVEGGCPVDYGYDARAEVLGSEGVILIGELQDTAVTTCTKQAGVVTSTFRSWRNRFWDAYIAEARHFVECILQDRDPLVTGQDGRKAMEAVLAGNKSVRSGRPVSLPLD